MLWMQKIPGSCIKKPTSWEFTESVNKALLVVLTMCLALLQRGETLSFVFNILCST